MNIQQAIENTKKLSASEKALLAHCLISSLDQVQEDSVDEAWSQLAKQRAEELESGKVQGVTWSEIKKELKA